MLSPFASDIGAPEPKGEESPLQLTPAVGLLAVLLVGLVSVVVVRLRK